MTIEEINVASIARSRVENVKPLAELSGVCVRFETCGAPVFLHGDRMAISRVIQNPLDNSLRYTPAGGTVKVRLKEENHRMMIEIEDNGPGIPEEEKYRMFERFQQGSAGRRSTTGSGLGLYLCKQIITAHGGTIGVKDTEGGGTTFWFTIPKSTPVT